MKTTSYPNNKEIDMAHTVSKIKWRQELHDV